MKKTIILFSLILLANALLATITVDGYTYLENQTGHSGIEVLFERTAPSSLTYTIYTNTSGYYTADIETGIYEVSYSKDNYPAINLYDVVLYSNVTLVEVYLYEGYRVLKVPDYYTTIQQGIDIAEDCDIVLVSNGTYYENIQIIGEWNSEQKNIMIKSVNGPENCIIDGNDNDIVINIESGTEYPSILISGFTIINGNNCNGGDYGGGIKCENTTSYGGYVLTIKNCLIYDNFAGNGGAGICSEHYDLNLINVSINNNSMWGGYYGSAVLIFPHSSYNVTTYLNLKNSIISDNMGKGIYVNDWYDADINISYSDFFDNEDGNFYNCGDWVGINVTTNANGDSCDVYSNIQINPLLEVNNYLSDNSPCIDAGDPDSIYNDPEDPNNLGFALYPAMGTTVNDMGTYGGPNAFGWIPVSIEDDAFIKPIFCELFQNYPNPFNPTTTISFSFIEESTIELIIYNIKGQKIKTLAQNEFTKGLHSIIWNGDDESENPVSSGVYLYKLNVNGKTEAVKKCLLLK